MAEKKSAQECMEASVKRVLKDLDKLEADIAKAEDQLGLPRSAPSDPLE